MKTLVVALFVFACGCGGGTGAGPGGDAGSSPTGGATTGGTCPLTATVDGTTYTAVSCTAHGEPTFAPGVYKLVISAPFNKINTNSGHIRSLFIVLTDNEDAPAATHLKTFTVSAENPGASAVYNVTQFDSWSTLDGSANVGSGSFTVTEYDKAAKVISGTYNIVVKQGTNSKTISGTLTHVAMSNAQ